jgi:hypothetical protein
MYKITKFVVLPYERRAGKLVRGEAQQFYTLGEAKGVRERMLRRMERVDLFEVTGWPVQDLWDRPRRVVD